MYRATIYGHHLLLHGSVLLINRVRLPNLLVVSSTGKSTVLADICIRGKYIYICWYSTAVCICLHTRYIINLGTCTFVHGSLLYMHICVATAVCM